MPTDRKTKGRPTEYDERMQIRSLAMPDHLVAFARDIGDSFADGVRKCIEREMDRQDSVNSE